MSARSANTVWVPATHCASSSSARSSCPASSASTAPARSPWPLIGEVSAKDRSTRDLEKEISTRLSAGYVKDPKVSVEVLNHRPFFILGEVRNPGQYQYVNGMTALSAVAMAGGYTYRAKEDYVLITRGADPKKELRRAPITTSVMPDDVVRVPERYF
nr:polysaccharide biosynthesis/export family protein [Azospirillum sp. INR13]